MKIFTDVSVEKQGRSEQIFVLEGGENAWGLLSKTFKLNTPKQNFDVIVALVLSVPPMGNNAGFCVLAKIR